MESVIDIATPVFEEENLESYGAEYKDKALVLQQAVAIEKIENEGQFQQVATAGLEAAANIKALEAYINPIKERAYAKWKRITTVLSAKIGPFEKVKEKSGQLIGVYQYEIKQQRLREENAERLRQAAEDEKTRAAQAEQLAKEGRIEDGVALLESPVVNVAPVMATTQVPKAQGVTDSGEGIFSAEVTDLLALVKAVAAGTVPIKAVEANMKFLNAQAKSMEQLLAYPGVKVNRTFKSQFRPK
jgi:hypothetical protein